MCVCVYIYLKIANYKVKETIINKNNKSSNKTPLSYLRWPLTKSSVEHESKNYKKYDRKIIKFLIKLLKKKERNNTL